MNDGPEIIAHRGYSAVAPENTLAAIRAAQAAGATAIEADLRTAIDGTPVLFHDVHLGRTSSGVGPVRRRTVAQLKSLDAGAWFSDEHAGETIPTLAEALECLGSATERFYAEVKGYREMEDLDRMVEIVRSADFLPRTVFLASDWTVLERIAQTEPSVDLGYVVEEREDYDEALRRAADRSRAILDLEAALALETPSLVRDAVERGVEVAVWTVNRVEDAETLRDAGVTRFTTDEVESLLAWARGSARA